MKTPKSAKKGAMEATSNVETPMKTKTPKKMKTPKEEGAKTPKTLSAETPKPKEEAKTSKPAKFNNGDTSGGEGFFFKGGRGSGAPQGGGFRGGRGGFRGGRGRGGARGGFRGGRGGFRGGRGGGFGGFGSFGGFGGFKGEKAPNVLDPLGVFLLFQDCVNGDIAKALLEKYKGAAIEFSRGVTIRFKKEEDASKAKDAAANIEFGGMKPIRVGEAYQKHEFEKRPAPEDSETGLKKKQKVEVKKDQVEEEEESGEEEEESDEEEETGEEQAAGKTVEEEEDEDDEEEDEEDEEEDDEDEEGEEDDDDDE